MPSLSTFSCHHHGRRSKTGLDPLKLLHLRVVSIVPEEAFYLADHTFRIVDPGDVLIVGEADDAEVPVPRSEGLALFGPAEEGVAFAPQEQRRHLERLPALAQDQTTPETPDITQTATQAEVTAGIPMRLHHIFVEQ